MSLELADLMPISLYTSVIEIGVLLAYWAYRLWRGFESTVESPQHAMSFVGRVGAMVRGLVSRRGCSVRASRRGIRAVDTPAILLAVAGVVLIFWKSSLVPQIVDLALVAVLLIEFVRLGGWLLHGTLAPLMLPLTFLGAMLIGSIGLSLPACTHESISWIDSLFTSTSAVCVTGLTVRDTASTFTIAGQVVVLVFIQLGGLGIVLFGAGVGWLFGEAGSAGRGGQQSERRSHSGTRAATPMEASLRGSITLREVLEHASIGGVRQFVLVVLIATLSLELLGAMLLFAASTPEDGTIAQRLWASVFHSVSAFCNAGFDISGTSAIGWRERPAMLLPLMALMMLGSLGFPVVLELWRVGVERYRAWWCGETKRRRVVPLNLHARATIITTAVLYIAGFIILGLAQRAAPMEDQEWRVLSDAAFMSVSARTAGFTSVPSEELAPASRVALTALMFIGGSPGSVAGGMKTTTLAVLVLAAVATVRGRAETEAFGRAIPERIVRKAGAVALSMLGITLGSTLLLSMTDPAPMNGEIGVRVFESVSAATTTGLSLGITPELSTAGKLVLIATMFLGRVGPLFLVGALIMHKPPGRGFAFPREEVTLG